MLGLYGTEVLVLTPKSRRVFFTSPSYSPLFVNIAVKMEEESPTSDIIDLDFTSPRDRKDLFKIIEYRKLKREVRPLLVTVQQGPLNDFEKSIFSDNTLDDDEELVNDEVILKLQQLHQELLIKVESQKEMEKELFSQILENRSKLGHDENVLFEFTNARVGIVETLKNLLREQTIAIESRKRWISKSILELREELLAIWKQCMVMNAEGANFKDFYSMNFTEELLEKHKKELEVWKENHIQFQVIVRKIAKRTELWVRVKELQAKNEDPNRFSNRGATILRVQKELNLTINTLLKIEEELITMAEKFEVDNNRKLLISGQQMPDLIKQDWADFEEGIIKRGLRPPPILKSGQSSCFTPRAASSKAKLTASQSLPNIATKGLSRKGSRSVTPRFLEKVSVLE